MTFNGVTLGDGLAGLRSLRAGAIQLILSDLPSGETAASFDERPHLPSMWSAFWHALGQRGVAVVMAHSMRFACDLIESQRSHFRHDLIWVKSHKTGFLNAARAPLRQHENILVFSRGSHTFNKCYDETHKPIGSNGHGRARKKSRNYGADLHIGMRKGATDRVRSSVLSVPSVATRDPERIHPQQKPTELMAKLIEMYSNPGDMVADPFAGSGTTGRACALLGRWFVGWDKDPEFA